MISPVYNKTLLSIIKEAHRISYDELKEKLPHKSETVLKKELDTLVELGFIREDNGEYMSIER